MWKLFITTLIAMISGTQLSQPVQANLTGPTYQELRRLEGYRTVMPSQGDVNMLVIPIQFSDATCAIIPEGCEQTKANIHQAFFGEPDSLRWHSVRSFYQASSYGQLRIQGHVSDWYTANITAVALSQNRSLLTSQVINPALEAVRQGSPGLLADYDRDDDGYLDAVYFIYSLTFNPEGEEFGAQKDVFWAFVSYQSALSNVNSPGLFHFGWSSYDFMYQDGYYQRSANGKVEWDENNEPIFFPWLTATEERDIDAHVYIHETGHLLGLQDYYTYDQDKGDWGATGTLDMMDYNVGDHHGFSKSILGWVTPTVVTTPQIIELKPFAHHPEVILVKATHPLTLLNEYLLLEYYRPENLNEKDSRESYAGRYPRMFTEPGLKIYHVDARIGRWIVRSGQSQFDQYVTTIDLNAQYRHRIASTNTASTSFNPNHKLIHLLEAGGLNTFRNGGFATNATLFQTGDIFPHQRPWMMNDGTPFPFQIRIETITENAIQIHIQFPS